jgi:hypothetical protein
MMPDYFKKVEAAVKLQQSAGQQVRMLTSHLRLSHLTITVTMVLPQTPSKGVM